MIAPRLYTAPLDNLIEKVFGPFEYAVISSGDEIRAGFFGYRKLLADPEWVYLPDAFQQDQWEELLAGDRGVAGKGQVLWREVSVPHWGKPLRCLRSPFPGQVHLVDLITVVQSRYYAALRGADGWNTTSFQIAAELLREWPGERWQAEAVLVQLGSLARR